MRRTAFSMPPRFRPVPDVDFDDMRDAECALLMA